MILASSAKQEEVDHYLDLLDARELVDGWTTSADVESDQARARPRPRGAGEGRQRRTLGDGRRLGLGREGGEGAPALPTLAVLTGGFSEAELREAGAVQVVESIDELDSTRYLRTRTEPEVGRRASRIGEVRRWTPNRQELIKATLPPDAGGDPGNAAGPASPARLSSREEIGPEPRVISYHAKTLVRCGCLELVRSDPRGGAIENFFGIPLPATSFDSPERAFSLLTARAAISSARLRRAPGFLLALFDVFVLPVAFAAFFHSAGWHRLASSLAFTQLSRASLWSSGAKTAADPAWGRCQPSSKLRGPGSSLWPGNADRRSTKMPPEPSSRCRSCHIETSCTLRLSKPVERSTTLGTRRKTEVPRNAVAR